MKKIIGVVIASLMFANIGYAEMRLIEEKYIKARSNDFYVTTFCIDGYKFVEFSGGGSRGMVQFFKQESRKYSIPAKC